MQPNLNSSLGHTPCPFGNKSKQARYNDENSGDTNNISNTITPINPKILSLNLSMNSNISSNSKKKNPKNEQNYYGSIEAIINSNQPQKTTCRLVQREYIFGRAQNISFFPFFLIHFEK